jgi:LysW-gamma-L-lysine/LysW-L-ornithine aminotransferase
MNIITTERHYGSGIYAKRDLVLVRGCGARLWDDKGQEYIDCAAGIGVANLGHCHPAVVAAVTRQSQTLITCQEMFYNDRRAELLARLAAVLPGGLERLFLCNSGSEAVEAAIKFARLATGRGGVVAARRGFHGRTLGALSATHKKEYREPFVPLVPGFRHVPFNDADRLAQSVNQETAAVILEIVQGEGGVRPAVAHYLRAARRLCYERGALLIVDEVQTGFGRTGRWFACDHFDLQPDLLCLGKALAGGLPMGAVAMGPRVTGLTPGVHGSTFGGNPLVCAAAGAAIEAYRAEDLPGRAAVLGHRFLDRLQRLDSHLVRDVRGLGLMVGVELKVRAMPVVQRLAARGVIALTAGTTVLRFLPPLIIAPEDLDTVASTLQEVLRAQSRTHHHEPN